MRNHLVDKTIEFEEGVIVTVWVPILLLLILAEIWWFGVHCTTYLSDIRNALTKASDKDRDEQTVTET